MPTSKILFFLVLTLGCVNGCGHPPSQPNNPNTITILISIDGLPQYSLKNVPKDGTLSRLLETGARARGLRPVFPSKTFPNHYSQVTGLYPTSHGIIGNYMFDPSTQSWFGIHDVSAVQDSVWWGGEPIWVTAKANDIGSAAMFWPGSEAEIGGQRPDHWNRFDASMDATQRVAMILNWLDQSQRPRFLTLYFEHLDVASHTYGPKSPEALAALRRVDDALSELISGLEQRNLRDQTNLVIVSDHGMAETSPKRLICLNDYVDVSANTWAGGSPVLMLWPSSDEVVESLKTAHPNFSIYSKSQTPPRWRITDHPRVGQYILVADDGWIIRRRCTGDSPRVNYGDHGYDNELRSMQGVLIGNGPAFQAGALGPTVNGVDVYELLCHLLGVQPAPNEGDFAGVSELLISR